MTVADFDVSYDIGAGQMPDVLGLFASTWWAARRTPDETRQIIVNSDVVIAVRHPASGRVVGFARALTDEVHLAVILDVIVAPGMRGSGVGALVMDAVLGHPKVAGVRSIELVCRPELLPFYRRWGFTDEVGGSRLMRRTADPDLIGDG